MRWTIAQVAGAVGARPGAGLDPMARVAGVSIDSRTLRAGELFIAIHGPRHDGHDHVARRWNAERWPQWWPRELGQFPDAIRRTCLFRRRHLRGAQAVCTRGTRSMGRQDCGRHRLGGKTTTKEILAALLGAKLRVLKSEGNFNNEYGLPLTLFRLDETHEAAVLEMGMSRRGELARLAEIARPDVGVVTRVCAGASGIFCLGGRDCFGQARID